MGNIPDKAFCPDKGGFFSGLQMDASDLLGSFHHPVQCFCFFFFFFKAVQLLYYTEMQLVRILLLEQQQRSISILGDR